MELAKRNELTVRIAYNLFTQNAKQEIEDFAKWVKLTMPGDGDDFLKMNGAGEMLVFSAADFEDFLEPRPDLPDVMESKLEAVGSERLRLATRAASGLRFGRMRPGNDRPERRMRSEPCHT
jgi:predicted amidohydrolase YtcJ